MISYKKSHNKSTSNKNFNYNLSRIRIRSEHAIEYLKNRFQFLKKFRIAIHNEQNIVYVACWINACIVLHVFVIDEKKFFKDFEKNEYLFEHVYNESDRIFEKFMQKEIAQNNTRVRNQTLIVDKIARLKFQFYFSERFITRFARRWKVESSRQ